MGYENIAVEKEGAIGIVTLNRPQLLNALSYGLVKELALAMEALDQDPEVRVLIVTGGEKVFAAGADIKEMADAGPFDERGKKKGDANLFPLIFSRQVSATAGSARFPFLQPAAMNPAASAHRHRCRFLELDARRCSSPRESPERAG
jgi:enoyl-CoA hydratase/carnithine racemase